MSKIITPTKNATADSKATAFQDDLPEPLASVDKIRDIIFGSQIKNYEARFVRLEENLIRETAELKDTMRKRFESLESFFKPHSLAVIGASARRGTIGGELFRNVIAADFSGAAYPVNQKGDPVGGVPGYRSVEEIPAPVELAVVCVPGEQVLAAAESALRAGVRAVCVISAGDRKSVV